MRTVKSQSHLSITPGNNYNLFTWQKCRVNVSLFYFSLYTFLAREWPEGVTFCEGIVWRLPHALESERLLYKAHIRQWKRHPEIAGRFAKKPGGGNPENSAAVAGAVLRIVGRHGPGISTLVLRYSLAPRERTTSKKCLPWLFVLWPCISQSHTECQSLSTDMPFHCWKKAESPGVASYTVFWMNRIIRSCQVFPLIPLCGHIVGLSE